MGALILLVTPSVDQFWKVEPWKRSLTFYVLFSERFGHFDSRSNPFCVGRNCQACFVVGAYPSIWAKSVWDSTWAEIFGLAIPIPTSQRAERATWVQSGLERSRRLLCRAGKPHHIAEPSRRIRPVLKRLSLLAGCFGGGADRKLHIANARVNATSPSTCD